MSTQSINPFYARRHAAFVPIDSDTLPIGKRVIGNATLYRADCFDILPQLSGMGAVISDPPYTVSASHIAATTTRPTNTTRSWHG